MNGELSPAVLWMLIGAVFSILVDMVPGFSSWFDGKTKNVKRWVMLSLLLVVSGAIFGLNCWVVSAPYIVKYVYVTCSEAGFLDLVNVFVLTIVGNQAAFLLLPKISKPPPASKGFIKSKPYKKQKGTEGIKEAWGPEKPHT